MTSIDRRSAYYARTAKLIADDPLGFYTRAENGRRIQSAIKRSDYVTPRPHAIIVPFLKVNRRA